MADSVKSTVDENKRIIYVEPNDIYGKIDGVGLTPDYSDYCISVNLIAEVVTRYRQTGGESAKEFICSFSCKPGDESAKTWVSFLQGEDARKFGGGNENFLTTYYTDINYNDVVKKNIVEGLGIESVQVSFESYYTPTIVIKFVDVRGSSLFGREEAVHESGEDLSQSSVFGVFFTVPYPKFKLQIKGFYGHGVTYQLTCSDFRASFNSNTGNFEAVVTFIGYSYSLLTDIPLRYLIAAPYCSYIGREYWERHINTPEWALSDGKQPQKLFYIIERIKSLLNDNEIVKKIMSDEETEKKNNINNERRQLSTLATTLKEYINALRELNQTRHSIWLNGDGEDEEQVLIFANQSDVTVGDKVRLTSQAFIEAFDAYNSSNNGKAFSYSLLPNASHSILDSNDKLIFTKFCDIVKEGENITKLTFTCENQNVAGIKTIELNNGITMCDVLAQYVYNDTHLDNGGIKDYFAEYCYIINVNKFLGKINERIENLVKEDKAINDTIAEKVQEAAKLELGFTPYIGDVFKIIMCHLETFIHMMWGCYRNIENGNRTPEYLNLPLDRTDFVNIDKNKGRIGAWPGIFNNGKKTKDGGDEDKSIEALAWVGDFSHNFEEEKFIIALYKAIRHIDDEKQSAPKPLTLVTGLPIMPSDINDMSGIFGSSIENNMSALAGYLSFRAAQIFGVLLKDKPTVELARSFGKMDAYNFFTHIQSRSEIKNTYLNASYGSSMESILYGISKCSDDFNSFCDKTYQETNKSRHTFETVYSVDEDYNRRQRHPLFTENGSNLKYVHYYTKNKVGIVPDALMTYKGYENVFSYKTNGTKPYFIFNKRSKENEAWKQNGFLYRTSDSTLFTDIGEIPADDAESYKVREYINDDMFSVDINTYLSDSVKQKFDELKSGTFKILGDEFTDDFSDVLGKLWHVEDKDYGKYFNGNSYMLSRLVKDIGITPEELYPLKRESSDDTKAPSTVDNEKWINTEDDTISYKVDENDGKWVNKEGNEVSMSTLCIRYFQSVFPKSNGEYEYQNLFGDPFYYLQNDVIEGYVEEEQERLSRQRHAKALLFLHTFNYDFTNVPDFLKRSKKAGGIYILPYGYVLLLGGLLWRDRYIAENGKDPVQSGVNSYKQVGNDKTLFAKIQDGQYRMCALMDSDTQKYDITVSSIFGGDDNWRPDYHITNELISTFENFVNNEWGQIISKLELQSIKNEDGEHKVYPYTCETFKHDVELFKKDMDYCLKYTGKQIYIKDFNKNIPANAYILYRMRIEYFSNFLDNYRYAYVKKDYRNGGCRGLLLLLNEDNRGTQKLLKELYTRKITVSDSCGYSYRLGETSVNNKEIVISSEIFKSYLNGFRSKIEEISQNENTDATVTEYGEVDVTIKRDIVLPIYLYLKTLWDRWLVSTTNKKLKSNKTISYEDYYNVENFFSSFIFIDSFYTNIYKKLMINCESLKRSYMGRDEDGSLLNFMADIVKDHHCLFIPLPDYVDMGNSDSKKAVEEMKNMFRPIPYSQMNDMDSENRFVIIYNPKMSEYPSSDTGHREDYFRIWNPVTNRWDDDLPDTFKTEPASEGNNDMVSRYGYYVPSFGVAFSRQNNHMFKNINLNMSSPLVTSQSIQASAHIAEMGSGAPHKVAFLGQDLYPVFSNYSYICEIEMMGDAQVQPLMYFQLMNIPMWSGVYMIFNVTHTISAGNMTTRFKGMKLARNPLPYTSSWFMFNPENINYDPYEYGDYSGNEERDEYRDDNLLNNEVTVISGENYHKAVGNVPNHYDDRENYANEGTWKTRNTCENGGNVSVNLKSLYNRLYEEIKSYQERNGGRMKWNVGFTSIGHGGHVKSSQHYRGFAMDLQLTKFDENGKCKGVIGGQNKTPDSNYFIVMDLLFSLHFNEIHQCIYEVYNKSQYYDPVRQYQPKCLHVGIKERDSHNTQFFTDNGNYHNFMFDSRVLLPEFKGIASKFYKTNQGKFKSVFINFINFTNKQLQDLFGGNTIPVGKGNDYFNQWYKWSMSWEGSYGGATPVSYRQYKNDGGTSSNPTVEDIALVSFWEANHLNNINDPSVAIMCMYTIYWTGNCALISNALNGTRYNNTSKSPWRLKTNDIATINSRPGRELFNKIKKQAGEFILNPPSWAALPGGGDPGPGWRRRWFSIDYNPTLISNGGMGNKQYSEEDLRKAMLKL